MTPERDLFEAAVDSFYAALDDPELETHCDRGCGCVDGRVDEVVRALLAGGWLAPAPRSPGPDLGSGLGHNPGEQP